MKVKVKLFFTLGKYSPAGNDIHEVELEPNSSVEELIKKIGIPAEKVALIFVNGEQQKISALLQDGDEIKLFPAVAGG